MVNMILLYMSVIYRIIYTGTYKEKLEMARELCNDIEKRVDEFVKMI